MSRELTLQDRVKRIFKTRLTPYLVERGFKKDGRIYSRQVGRIQHLIDIQQSPYNRKDEVSFALNMGVHVPDVKPHFWKAPDNAKLIAASGILNVRPGFLVTPQETIWWYLKSSDDPDKDVDIGDDVLLVVEEGGFRRFFDRFKSERDVAQFLTEPRKKEDHHIAPHVESMCRIYAGIIWDQLGEYEKCKECMARAAELAKGKRLEADIEKFAREYVCGKLPRIA